MSPVGPAPTISTSVSIGNPSVKTIEGRDWNFRCRRNPGETNLFGNPDAVNSAPLATPVARPVPLRPARADRLLEFAPSRWRQEHYRMTFARGTNLRYFQLIQRRDRSSAS